MNIGYFKFNSKEEAERKEERFKRIKDIEKVFAGDSDESFFEFIDGINAENNIVIITSLADIGMTIGQQIEGIKAVYECGLQLAVLSDIESEAPLNIKITIQ